MNIINSKLTSYGDNWSVNGCSDEFFVPVKGTKYSSLGNRSVYTKYGERRHQEGVALLAGTEAAARRIVELMNAGASVAEVCEVAHKGILEREALYNARRERRERVESIMLRFAQSHAWDWMALCIQSDVLKSVGLDQEGEKVLEEALKLKGEVGCGPRYTLEDINPNFYNCGHYPQWEVRTSERGEYDSLAAAAKEARERNARSEQNWQRFLNAR